MELQQPPNHVGGFGQRFVGVEGLYAGEGHLGERRVSGLGRLELGREWDGGDGVDEVKGGGGV